MAIAVRAATAADSARLQAIEVAAGDRFRTVGLADVAEHDPFTAEELREYADGGRSFVAVEDDWIVGYVVIDCVGDAAHVEQVSVTPEAQGRGIGRRLIDQVCMWAREHDRAVLTLTTFRDVPWNEPLYAYLGFRVLGEDEISAELRGVRDHETEFGLDPERRVCMQLDL
jgi:GNAT superfamily N-acetyltransferase